MPDTVVQLQRSIVTIRSQMLPLAVSGDPCAWLAGHAQPGMVLLAHADDGVIWGRAAAPGALCFPAAAVLAQPPFRPATLLMARLFGETCETFLWRVAEGCWAARQIVDGAGADIDCIDEQQLLWGTRAEESDGAFTRVVEGSQGLLHAFPMALEEAALSDAQRPRLHVRHYLAEDQGWRRIAYSRLTGVSL